MGIKKSKTIYISDRGDDYYVEDMENSHLANTIAHIDKKIQALSHVCDYAALSEEEKENLRGHIHCLYHDQVALAKELAGRDSCKDEC